MRRVRVRQLLAGHVRQRAGRAIRRVFGSDVVTLVSTFEDLANSPQRLQNGPGIAPDWPQKALRRQQVGPGNGLRKHQDGSKMAPKGAPERNS